MIKKLHRIRFLLPIAIAGLMWFLLPFVKQSIEIDNSLDIWFLKDDPAVVEYQQFHKKFGNDEVLIAVIENKAGLLTTENLRKFNTVTKSLEALADVKLAITPGNASVIISDSLGVHTKTLIAENSSSEEVKNTLESVPELRQQLFNKSYTAARILISFRASPDFDQRRGVLLDSVKTIINQAFGIGNSSFGGVGVLYDGLNKLSQADFGFFLSIGYLVMFLLLLIIYRSIVILLYAMCTVGISTYVALGIYGLFGFHLNLMTVLIPCILIVLGIMDIMHILNEFYHQLKSNLKRKEAALLSLKKVFRPCLFTTLTTMAGFLSLTVSPMAILQQFGIFTAIGIFLCLIFSYLFGVLFLPVSKPATISLLSVQKAVNRFFASVLRRKKIYWAFSLAAIVLSITGLFLIESDTYTLGYFPKSSEAYKDNSKIEASWGPYMPVEFVVTPKPPYHLSDPDIIISALAFTESAKLIAGAGEPFGFHSLYGASLAAIYGDQAIKKISSKEALDSIHSILPSLYPDLYASFVNEKSNTGRITLFGGMMGSQELSKKIDTLQRISERTFGDRATVVPAGYQPLYAKIVSYVVTSQVESLLISALLIFILLYIFIRDVRIAFLSTIANLIPVIFMLGIMGWFHINLDTASASIAAIVLSICIDDTIHFIHKYKKNKEAGISNIEPPERTIQYLGSSIFLSSFVLIAGYSLMIFASLQTVILFGLLTVIALAAASFVSFVILPLILIRFDRNRLEKITK